MMPELVIPDWPAPPAVRAFTTTRAGGTSEGRWASLNLGDRCGDRPMAVAENRRRLRELLPSEPAWLKQVHGTEVLDLDDAAGTDCEADAAISRAAGRVCAVLTADCLPVLFCDRRGASVAVAHAGWRGLASGVLERTVQALGADPGDTLAWLGPGIGASAYEVGGEVRDAFIRSDPRAAASFTPRGNRWLADLYGLARQRLAVAGVRSVHGGTFCTYTEQDRFFSHRRDGGSGRMATVVWREP